jgi:glycosyltransferase involved in cell wall biosynthesis
MSGRSVLMLVCNDVAHDARVRREATSLVRAGYRVRVMGLWSPGLARRETVDGVEILRPRSRLLHSLVRRPRGAAGGGHAGVRRSPLRQWIYALASAFDYALFGVRALLEALGGGRPHIVHANDLNTLPAGYLVSRVCGARLVYDSHEVHLFTVGMLSMRPRGWRALCRHVERFCVRRADALFTVNDAFARAIARTHGVRRPVALYNAPRFDEQRAVASRTVRTAVGARAADPLAVYCGAIAPQRGVEEAIDALALAPGLRLALLGYGDPAYLDSLRRRAATARVGERLFFVPPVPPMEVCAAMRDADLSLVLFQDFGLTYRYNSPNKIPESMHAGLPIVGSDLPEIRRVLRHYDCGLVADPRDPAAIARAMRRIVEEPGLRARLAAGARAAAQRFNWETEEPNLLRAYAAFAR